MNYTELFERKDKNVNLGAVIALAKRAKQSLSSEARDVIDHWQASGWDSGPLEKAFRANTPLAQEVTTAFDPVRQAIKSLYGDTITLYRGQRKFEEHELTANRVLFSWTADERIANKFATDAKPFDEISDQEIQAALNQYQQRGFCRLACYAYKRSLETPGYFEIYRGHEHLGNDEEEYMEDMFRERQQDRREHNDSYKERGEVITHQVPVDLIVWVTNDLNSKEFIVKLNPLK